MPPIFVPGHLKWSEHRPGNGNTGPRPLRVGGVETMFPYEIKNAIETPYGVIVLVHYVDPKLDRNIYLVDPAGTVKWQVEKFSDQPSVKEGAQPYTSIALIDGKLVAFNFMGFDCEINPESGVIIDADFVK
jgi:hypothetical protein